MQMRRHGVQNAAFVCVPVDLLQGVQPLDAHVHRLTAPSHGQRRLPNAALLFGRAPANVAVATTARRFHVTARSRYNVGYSDATASASLWRPCARRQPYMKRSSCATKPQATTRAQTPCNAEELLIACDSRLMLNRSFHVHSRSALDSAAPLVTSRGHSIASAG